MLRWWWVNRRPYRAHVAAAVFVSLCLIGVVWDGDINVLHAATGSCPQYEAALAERGLPVSFFSKHMWQESRCNPTAFNASRRTKDLSFGLLMHNLYTPEAQRAYVSAGFTYDVLLTVDGNLNATVWRYNLCGTGPWVKTKHGYECHPPKVKASYR